MRYAESLSQTHLGIRIPRSTLHYWEVRRGDVVVEVLKALLRLLTHVDYDYSVMDSTKFTDWLKGLHELFIDVTAKHYSQSTLSLRAPRWSSLKGYLRAEG